MSRGRWVPRGDVTAEPLGTRERRRAPVFFKLLVKRLLLNEEEIKVKYVIRFQRLIDLTLLAYDVPRCLKSYV